MKIISLTAENVKRLTAVHIEPNGNLVQITGKNGQGKTSVLDAIWWALEGQKNIQKSPIRKGAKSALIKLDLGELKVTRTFSARESGFTTSIRVEREDGFKSASPQSLLDGLVGALSLDPLQFLRMKPDEQFNLLRGFVKGVDFDKVDAEMSTAFDKRTDVKRTADRLRSQAAGFNVPQNVPAAPIDELALIEQMQEAGAKNAAIDRDRSEREQSANRIQRDREEAARLRAHVEELRRQIEVAELRARAIEGEADKAQKALEAAPALVTPVDVSEVRTRIERARESNAAFELKRRWQETIAQAEIAEAEADDLTQKISDLREAKRKAVAEAKMPVPGIEFGEKVVLLNGVPFDQASDAEQLRTSIAIAGALSPKLRVIRVRDGSLLDEGGMKLLADYADANDLQVWIERVDSSGAVGFVLEDGHLVDASRQAAE